MARLFIDKIGEEYVTGKYKIKVLKEPYKGFRMFEKIRFIDVDEIPFSYFSINKHDDRGKAEYMFDYDSRTDQRPDNIEYVDVYVSKFHPTRVLIVKVSNAGVLTYYNYTEFKYSVKEFGILYFNEGFELEGYLSRHLISQNDEINKKTTYRVDFKENYNNIEVNKDENQLDYYTVYTHKPKEGKFQKYESCVLYKNILFQIDPKIIVGKKETYYVQNVVFESVKVYFDKSEISDDVPLLVHFIYSNIYDERNKKHFFFSKFKHERYWKSQQINYNDEKDINNIKKWLDKTHFQTINLVKVHMSNKKHYTHSQNQYFYDKDSTNQLRRRIISKNEVKVDVCKKFPTGKISGYVCYDHNFGPFFGGPQDNKPEKDIFKLFICSKQIEISEEEDENNLLHTLTNHNAYVYFYGDDNFPLLVKFEKYFYGPKSKDKYFTNWEKIMKLEETDTNNLFNENIIEELDKINSMLNEIDINKTSDYGIDDYEYDTYSYHKDHVCDSKICEIKCEKIYNEMRTKQENFDRILVHKHDFDFFTKYTHITKNNFRIGNIVYNSKELSSKNTKIFINDKLNSVTVYFFKFDAENTNKLPLLLGYGTSDKILEYNTVKLGDKPEVQKYQFKNEINSEYFHREFNEFLDHQNCVLNKVMTINLDKKENYSSCDKFVEREKAHEIIVTDVSIAEDPSLNRAGYRTFRHHTGILGNTMNTKQISLYNLFDPDIYKTPIIIKNFKINNHTIHLINLNDKNVDYLNKIRVAYVHFYGDDPRPLLVYCGDMVFAPKSLETYYNLWYQTENFYEITNDRIKYNLNLINEKLDEVIDMLNPVDLSNPCTYSIHKFGKHNIIINVKSEDFLMFRKYTHTPRLNHRLGTIKFNNHNVFKTNPLNDYNSSELESASAYYYKSDKYHHFPVVVELRFKNKNIKLFYQLTSIKPNYEWEEINESDLRPIFSNESSPSILENQNFKFNKVVPDYIKKSYRVYKTNCNKDSSKIGPFHFTNEGYTSSGFEQYEFNSYGNRGNYNTGTLIKNDPGATYDSIIHGSHSQFEIDTYDPDLMGVTGFGTSIEEDFNSPHYNLHIPKTGNSEFPSTGDEQTDFRPEGEESSTKNLPGVIGGVIGSVGVVGGGGFALYKFVGTGIFDMRPIF